MTRHRSQYLVRSPGGFGVRRAVLKWLSATPAGGSDPGRESVWSS